MSRALARLAADPHWSYAAAVLLVRETPRRSSGSYSSGDSSRANPLISLAPETGDAESMNRSPRRRGNGPGNAATNRVNPLATRAAAVDSLHSKYAERPRADNHHNSDEHTTRRVIGFGVASEEEAAGGHYQSDEQNSHLLDHEDP